MEIANEQRIQNMFGPYTRDTLYIMHVVEDYLSNNIMENMNGEG